MAQALKDVIIAAFDTFMGWLLSIVNAFGAFIGNVIQALWTWMSAVVAQVWAVFSQSVINAWLWALNQLQAYWNGFLLWAQAEWPKLKVYILEHLSSFATWITDQLQALGVEVNIDQIKSATGTLADIYADAAWLLPLNGVLAIIAGTFIAVGFIRIVRWVVSAIWITG